MRRITLSLCVVFVLALAADTVLAQGKGEGKKRGGRTPAGADVNAPAVNKEKSPTPQDIEKQTKEKGKGLTEQAREQARTQGKGAKDQATGKMAETRGKAVKDQAAEKMAETRGKANEQQMRAFERQIQHETAKHMERQARLARIRELAVQKGDEKMIARVDELIAKENQLHERKLLKMQGQKRAGGTLPPTEIPAPAKGGKGKDKVEKPTEKPAEPKAESQTPPPAEKPVEPKPQ